MYTWRDFCKTAQSFGFWAPAHSPSAAQEFHKETTPTAKKVVEAPVRAVSSASGAAIGALQQYREAIERGSLPVPGGLDYVYDPSRSIKDVDVAAAAGKEMAEGVRVGARVGWNEAGRVVHDAATTGAMTLNDFGLIPDSKALEMRKRNDIRILDQAKRYNVDVPANPLRDEYGLLVPTGDPNYEEYDRFVSSARNGQMFGRMMFDTAAELGGSKLLARGGGAIGPAYGWAGGAIPTAAASAKTLTREWGEGGSSGRAQAVSEYDDLIYKMSTMDPSSDEYRKRYALANKQKHLHPEAFSALPPPNYNAGPSATYNAASGAGGQAALGNGSSRGAGWSMSPEVQNLLGYGLGGAVLGGLFGGKGSWWKWALLGALLGQIHKGYGLDNIWNNISQSFGSSKK